jgi:hypothetical protein
MRLRDDPDALRVLVDKVVQKTTIPRRHIEKHSGSSNASPRMSTCSSSCRPQAKARRIGCCVA